MADGELFAALDAIRVQADGSGIVLADDTLRLLATMDALLKPHEPMPMYRNAEGCDHPEPAEPGEGGDQDALRGWDEWDDNHQYGTGSSAGERICLLTQIGTACPACSALVYDVWGDEGDFVDVDKCLVRPVITRELLGEDQDG